ncbi:hypothetical protein [uncultured Treponema sp.]|uniref:hypothetical protein n=1 Tax=uncultured Treponema sp. TaxID=162155 RepID=UPI002591CC9E|nr:hypothetical protein [uncultured Treponema sp.]
MQVDFYKYAESVKPVKEFGLVDPDDKDGKKPAFVSYSKSTDKWNAIVECNNRSDYYFIAVDNNVPLTVKINGKDETASSCDAMLFIYSKTICFVELKADKKGNDWLNHGMEQLTKTITFFGDELDKYENKRAYLCNSRRPFVPSIHKIAQQKFLKKNKVVLRIKTEIEELK